MATTKARAREEESYFISMTDMMIGLLFIFIIMLMYFALQYKDSDQQLRTADVTRTEILQKLEKALKDQGVEVQIDTETGVLRLPDDVLFNRGEAKPKAEGIDDLEKLAGALANIIPCYAFHPSEPRPGHCNEKSHTEDHKIELLYIEGHTDSTPIDRAPFPQATPIYGGRLPNNWDLSTERARITRQMLVEAAPLLDSLRSAHVRERSSAPILTHVGHADSRKICDESGTQGETKLACDAKNRRIDLRIIMAKPKPAPIGEIETSIGSGG